MVTRGGIVGGRPPPSMAVRTLEGLHNRQEPSRRGGVSRVVYLLRHGPGRMGLWTCHVHHQIAPPLAQEAVTRDVHPHVLLGVDIQVTIRILSTTNHSVSAT